MVRYVTMCIGGGFCMILNRLKLKYREELVGYRIYVELNNSSKGRLDLSVELFEKLKLSGRDVGRKFKSSVWSAPCRLVGDTYISDYEANAVEVESIEEYDMYLDAFKRCEESEDCVNSISFKELTVFVNESGVRLTKEEEEIYNAFGKLYNIYNSFAECFCCDLKLECVREENGRYIGINALFREEKDIPLFVKGISPLVDNLDVFTKVEVYGKRICSYFYVEGK